MELNNVAVKRLRRLYRRLREDTQAVTAQKDLMVRRAVFLACRLETMEAEALTGGEFDPGKYSVMCNSLIALLKLLGIEHETKDTLTLTSYLKDRS